ncbi:MAG: hypothetical protein WBV61_03870 [Rhodanobacteraceae bacterium]
MNGGSEMTPTPFGTRAPVRAGGVLAAALVAASGLALAGQIDIQGPPGSELFGAAVALLPNGNFVLTDPYFSTPNAHRAGAVYLYAFACVQSLDRASAPLRDEITGWLDRRVGRLDDAHDLVGSHCSGAAPGADAATGSPRQMHK